MIQPTTNCSLSCIGAPAENLRFFVKFGMHPDDGCDYVIVVQGDDDASVRLGCCSCILCCSTCVMMIKPLHVVVDDAEHSLCSWHCLCPPTTATAAAHAAAQCTLPAPPQPLLRLGHHWLGAEQQAGGHKAVQVRMWHLRNRV